MKVHEVVVPYFVLRTYQIGAVHERVFDLLALSCIPFVVLYYDALTGELRPRLHRKLSPSVPWLSFACLWQVLHSIVVGFVRFVGSSSESF